MKGDYNSHGYEPQRVVVRDDPHMKGDYNDETFLFCGGQVRDDPHMKGDYNTRCVCSVCWLGSR